MNAQQNRIFYTLFFSVFCAVLGVGIVIPLLPVYAKQIGSSGLQIGLIFGAFSISRTLMLPFFGRRSDATARKPFIVFGLLCYAFVSVAFVYSTGVHTLIVIRFVQGIASAMILPVAQAYLGDITLAGSEGRMMGLFNLSMFSGLSLGPLAGGMISQHFDMDTAYFCMGVLSAAGFLMCLLLLPSSRQERQMHQRKPPAAWGLLLADRELNTLMLLRFAHTSCIGMLWGFLPVYAGSVFNLSPMATGTLVTMSVLVSGLLNWPMGVLSDRMSKKPLGILGGLIVAVSVASMIRAGGFWDLFWASAGFGIGGGMMTPAVMGMAVGCGSRMESMGSVMALMTVGHSTGMMVGSVSAGWIMDRWGITAAFGVMAALMAACTVWFALNPYRPR